MTKKTTSRALLSLAISASLVFTAANAAGTGFILDEAIHDYSDDPSRHLQASPSQQGRGGYDVNIVLDESYHDYGVDAFESIERAEFAAFEESSSDNAPKSSASPIPWVSEVY